jgi:hypothetical protein
VPLVTRDDEAANSLFTVPKPRDSVSKFIAQQNDGLHSAGDFDYAGVPDLRGSDACDDLVQHKRGLPKVTKTVRVLTCIAK